MDYKDIFTQAKQEREAEEAEQQRQTKGLEQQAKEHLRTQRKREYDFIASISDEVNQMLRGYMEAHGCPKKPLKKWEPVIRFDGPDYVKDPYATSAPNRMVATWTDGCDYGNGHYFMKVSFIYVQTIRKTFFAQTESWDSIGFQINDLKAPNHLPTISHLANALASSKPELKYEVY